MFGYQWLLLLFTLAQMTLVVGEPGAGEMVCFVMSSPDSRRISLIYYKQVDDAELYKRRDKRIPVCAGASAPVGLDACRVCLDHEAVIAACNLTNPSEDLHFEAGNEPLDKTLMPCALVLPTPSPAPPTPSPAPPTPSPAPPAPPGLGAGYIALITTAAVIVVALGVAAYIQRKKWFGMNPCSRAPGPSRENEVEMTERLSAANGHAPPSPC